jgi:hypothetical protein
MNELLISIAHRPNLTFSELHSSQGATNLTRRLLKPKSPGMSTACLWNPCVRSTVFRRNLSASSSTRNFSISKRTLRPRLPVGKIEPKRVYVERPAEYSIPNDATRTRSIWKPILVSVPALYACTARFGSDYRETSVRNLPFRSCIYRRSGLYERGYKHLV